MGNTSSTPVGEGGDEHGGTGSGPSSRNVSRSPSLRSAQGRRAGANAAAGTGTGAAHAHDAAHPQHHDSLAPPSTSPPDARSRSRSGSLQGFWGRGSASGAHHAGGAAHKGAPAAAAHAHEHAAAGGEPSVSSPLRRELSASQHQQQHGLPRFAGGQPHRRMHSIELPDLMLGGGPDGADTPLQTPSIAQRRSSAQARNAVPQAAGAVAGDAAAGAAHAPASAPIPAPGFPAAASKFASPLASPIVGTDAKHAHGTVTSGASDAARSRASSISSTSGPGTASAAAAAAAAAAAGSSGTAPPKKAGAPSEVRHSALFSTDVGDLSALDELAAGGATLPSSRDASASRAGAGSFGSLASSGVLSPTDAHGPGGAGMLGATDGAGLHQADPLGRTLTAALPSYLKIPTAIPSENVSVSDDGDVVPVDVLVPDGDGGTGAQLVLADGFSDWRSSSPPTASALGPMVVGPDGQPRPVETVPLAGYAEDGTPSKSATVAMVPSQAGTAGASSSAASAAPPQLPPDVSPMTSTSEFMPTMLAHDSAGRYVPQSASPFLSDQPLVGQTAGSISAQELEEGERPAPPAPSAAPSEKDREGAKTPTPESAALGSAPLALTSTGAAGHPSEAKAAPSSPRTKDPSTSGPTRVYGFAAPESGSSSVEPPPPTKLESSASSSKGSAATLKGLASSGMTPAVGTSAATTPAKESFSRPQAKHHPRDPHRQHHHPHHHHYSHARRAGHVPLMPIVITWRAGGREVFVTGTFANEWRSKIPLRRSKRDHTCILHLPPGTHRLKFIVDDRWRVSKDLPTASDGDGNLVNYVEIPNVGPAHPGPLSAPGEEMIDDALISAAAADESAAQAVGGAGVSAVTGRMAPSTRGKTPLDSHRSTNDLLEEARRAEILRRGDLDDVFADLEISRKQEAWTSEIPASIVAAQEAEEAAQQGSSEGDKERSAGGGGSNQEPGNTAGLRLPVPPTLPRQLEKVILNSSPAATAAAVSASSGAGNAASITVDDNSVLPAPNHVVLNHLTASAIKSGVLAVGTTTRYKRKYVTTVFYRPVKT